MLIKIYAAATVVTADAAVVFFFFASGIDELNYFHVMALLCLHFSHPELQMGKIRNNKCAFVFDT